jgi:myosin heavy subunit
MPQMLHTTMHGGVVLAQLEALGVLEAVSLMTLGFPTRIPYAAVHEQYASKLPAWAASLPTRELVEAIALAALVEPADVAYGATTLFCRAGRSARAARVWRERCGLNHGRDAHQLHSLVHVLVGLGL